MTIRAILFDLDNTLIDFWKFKNVCVNSAVDAMIKAGLKVDKKKAEKIMWGIYDKFGMEYSQIFQEFFKRIGKKFDYRIFVHALMAYRKARTGLLVSYPGVKKTLIKLKKKYKLAIISDAPKIKAWMRLAAMEIDDLFDVVLTFDDTGKRKPHHLPFKNAIKRLGLKPLEILMVGDSLSRDMAGAKALGMKTVLAVYGRTLKPKKKPENVDFMINKVDGLMKVVKKTDQKSYKSRFS